MGSYIDLSMIDKKTLDNGIDRESIDHSSLQTYLTNIGYWLIYDRLTYNFGYHANSTEVYNFFPKSKCLILE